MQRFNNLEDVYNTLVAAEFNFDSLPANNKYRKYKEWKQDPDKRKLPEGSAQDRGADVEVGLYPFGLVFEDANKTVVDMSGRSFTQLGSVGTNTLYNHLTGSLAGIERRPLLKPAKAVLAKKLASAQTVTAADNRITGQSYKKRTGETYTIPFGKGVAADVEFDVQNEILTSQKSGYSITFIGEKLLRK